MTTEGWTLIVVFVALVALIARPMGLYLAAVFEGRRTWLSPVIAPIEHVFYAMSGVRAETEQSWKGYAAALLMFSFAATLALFALMQVQHLLPLNPQGFGPVPANVAMNTAVSFVTNTNWQAYGGESTMSHLTQMVGLTVQNFLSAATGIAIAVAFVRGFARKSAGQIGNFWVDMTRATLYVLLPISILFALYLLAAGVPQTFAESLQATTLEGVPQDIAVGPFASQEAIKMLGTNGGGPFNANSAHPFENPDALTNLMQMLSIFAIGAGLVVMFGRMVGDERQGWAILAAMGLLFVVGTGVAYWAEAQSTPALMAAGVHNGWDKNDPKDAQVILHMLRTGLSQYYQDPLAAGISDIQELSKTHEMVSKAKTETLHRILTHYLPLYFPEIERFRQNSRSDWFFAFLEQFPTPSSIVALNKEDFIAAAWDVVGRKVSKARLLADIYETARESIALPVPINSRASPCSAWCWPRSGA